MPEPSAPQKKGLAIASLVCAFLCAPAALVLGIMALTKKDQGGKGMAIAGVVLGGLFTVLGGIGILAALLFPVLATAKEAANTTTCLSNLKQIGLGLRIYEEREGKPAPDLEAMYKSHDAPDLRLFLCKSCGDKPDGTFKTRYAYRVPPKQDDPGWDPAFVVAYDDMTYVACGLIKPQSTADA